jgi:uncharacterized protein (DUF1697 family)
VTTSVALLRAVNVGGRNRVPMALLREALAKRGLEDVSTILQSGNVLLRTGKAESTTARLVGDTIEAAFGVRVVVVVRSAAEFAAVAAGNPFLAAGSEQDEATLHIAFLSKRPTAAAVAKLDPDRSPPAAFAVEGREVYLSYPDGYGRSRLTLDYLEQVLGVQGTARNWRTVQRLAEAMASSEIS